MKKKLLSLFMVLAIALSSTTPAFAKIRLAQPVLADPAKVGSYITLTWTGSSNATSYNVYRSTSKDGNFSAIANTPYKYFVDENVEYGIRYYYKIKAINTTDDNYVNSKMSKWRSYKLTSTITTSTSSSYNTSQTVYITRTGSKYHRYGCQYLRQSCISINKSDATSYGYTACSRCW